MTRSELLEKIGLDYPDLKASELRLIVDTIFQEITETLSDGGRVEIRGFGAFTTRNYAARMGRNPKTGEALEVPARRDVYFRAGKALREKVNKPFSGS